MALLIAEIGNNHFGNIETAKELIKTAIACGADLIKGQAFRPEDIKGSMPPAFYKQCALSEDQYLELIEYTRFLKSDMFFSIFSDGFHDLRKIQKYQKFSAGQTAGLTQAIVDATGLDHHKNILSFNDAPSINFERATVLWATKYFEEIELSKISDWSHRFISFGLSDHTIGIQNSVKAVRDYGATVIEKHFTLKSEMSWANYKFRDTIHGSNPVEFESLASLIK